MSKIKDNVSVRIGFRSAELKSRMQAIQDSSNGAITASDIIKAALEEKLTEIETTGGLMIHSNLGRKAKIQMAPESRRDVKPKNNPGQSKSA